VVAPPPDRPLPPGVAAVAPRRPPTAGEPGRPPVPGEEGRPRRGQVPRGLPAVLEAIGLLVPGRALVIGAVADFGNGGGVARPVRDIREADEAGGGEAGQGVEIRGKDPVPALGPDPGAVVDVVVGPAEEGGLP